MQKTQVCTNVTETDVFSSTVTGETFQINHEFSCNNKCFIYLLKRKVCKKRFVREATDAFQLKWNKYKDNDRIFLEKRKLHATASL